MEPSFILDFRIIFTLRAAMTRSSLNLALGAANDPGRKNWINDTLEEIERVGLENMNFN